MISESFGAVIDQALIDITYTHKALAKVRRRACDFFINNGERFHHECELAGVDPAKVRAYALQKIKDLGAEDCSYDADDTTGRTQTTPRARPTPIKCWQTRWRAAKLYTHDGKSLTLKQWAEVTGLSAGILRRRLRDGWPIEQVLTEPINKTPKSTSGRQPKLYEHDGKSLTLKQWAEVTGINSETIRERLKVGWSLPDALSLTSTEAFRRHFARLRERGLSKQLKIPSYNGETKTLKQWSEECGISPCTIRNRINAGWSVEQALTQPLRNKPKSKAPIAQAA